MSEGRCGANVGGWRGEAQWVMPDELRLAWAAAGIRTVHCGVRKEKMVRDGMGCIDGALIRYWWGFFSDDCAVRSTGVDVGQWE